MNVQPAFACGAVDCAVNIELFNRAIAGKTAQPAHRDLYVAGAQLSRVVQILEFALVPHLHGPLVLGFAANADAFGIITRIAIRRRAAGSDPFVAAFVALFLFLKPLFQRLHQLVPAAHFFDLGHFLWRQIFLGDRL